MDIMESIYTIVVAIITVLGSAGAWRYYETQSKLKRDDDNFIKRDCRDRIAKLEKLLENSSNEKDDLRKTVLLLSKEVAALRVKVDFLEKENRILLEKNK
jgi:hypothetical protein